MTANAETENEAIDMAQTLRRRAEEQVRAKKGQAVSGLTPAEIEDLFHELQVHQIELEMQNEDLRQSQEALEESRSRYFNLYHLAPVGYVTLNERGVIRETNLTLANMLGTPVSALVNRPLAHFILPADQDNYYRRRRDLFETGTPQAFETRLIRPGGAPFWARLEGTLAQDAESGASMGRLVVSDITARKQATEEKVRLQTQLLQAQKMESVGRLAGGVAHNSNNMLQVILGQTELALMKIEPDHPLYTHLKEIKKAAERSAELTRQLLAFARKQHVTPTVLDLNDAITGMINMLRQLIGANIQLIWQPKATVWPIKMDTNQLAQMLINLCINARDAITGAGQITIETRNVTFDSVDAAMDPELTPGEYVLVTVSDNGHGMDEETQAHLFEPFFTTKAMGQGTGLGLATVYGGARQNNGFINVDSEPDKGSVFKIYLPRYKGKTAQRPGESETRPISRGQETVLLVEDEPLVLELSRELLESLGYTVLTAITPGEAIRLAETYHDPIDLLMTDVILPEMNGLDLARRLLVLLPNIKWLFMSGYTADIVTDRQVLGEKLNFIHKPFVKHALATKVREVLD